MEQKNAAFICTNCGFQGNIEKQIKGSFVIELVLWLFMILPGMLYSIWRLTTKKDVCPKCKTPAMIPLDTPKGQELATQWANKRPKTNF